VVVNDCSAHRTVDRRQNARSHRRGQTLRAGRTTALRTASHARTPAHCRGNSSGDSSSSSIAGQVEIGGCARRPAASVLVQNVERAAMEARRWSGHLGGGMHDGSSRVPKRGLAELATKEDAGRRSEMSACLRRRARQYFLTAVIRTVDGRR
jgi:hypothetical protein